MHTVIWTSLFRPQRILATAAACLVAAASLTCTTHADTLRNPAACGLKPWERSLRDVNLVNGNLFKSFTDIQVAPARGAGLVLQRTYNANDGREGPFGVGWTHAYDIRTEDTGADTMERTDFFGGKHSYVREADGLYKPPPYKRSLAATVATDALDDSVTADEEEDKDGTVKHFERIGNYRVCTWIEDRHGNRTNLTYSTSGLLGSVEDPSHRLLTFTWTDLGSGGQHHYRITSAQASCNSQAFQTVDYDYFEDGEGDTNDANRYSLRSVTLYPGGGAPARTTDYTYTTHTRGGTTEDHLLASIVDPLGQYVLYSYGDVGCDWPGNACNGAYPGIWVDEVDEPGSVDTRRIVGTDPAPFRHVWTFLGTYEHFYCSNNLCESSGGLRFDYTMDGPCDSPTRRLVVLSDGLAPEPGDGSDTSHYTYAYNPDMTVAQATRVAGEPWEHPGLFGQTNTEYNASGSPVETYPTGFANLQTGAGLTTREYYGAEKYFQLASTVDGRGLVTSYDYYPRDDPSPGNRGNLASVTVDPEGLNLKTSFTYNQYGQKETETSARSTQASPDGVVTKFFYEDAWGNLTGVIQDWAEDPDDHLMRTTEMTYDPSGRVTSFTDPAGQEITTTYNNLGQPLQVVYPGTLGETIAYSYEDNGRIGSVTAATTAATRIVQFSYETCDDDDDPNTPEVSLNDRVVNVTETVNSVMVSSVSYEYGLAGEVVWKYLPNGQVLQYDYGFDPENPESAIPSVMPRDEPDSLMPRLQSITDQDGRKLVEYTFDALGTLVEAKTNLHYEDEELVRYLLAQYAPETSVVDSKTYTRGLTQSVVNSWCEYDEEAQPPGCVPVRQLSGNAYTYDSGGNRLTNTITYPDESTRTEAYGYDALSRLTGVDYQYSGGTPDFNDAWWYDPAGNRQPANNHSYNVYNAANMLLSSGTNSYTNDLNGNTLSGGGRANIWDSQNRLAQTIYNNVTSAFTYGPDGLRRTATAGGVTTQYILDGQNVVQEVTSGPSGSETTAYLWGPRGPECRTDANGTRWFVYDGHGNLVAEAGQPDQYGNPLLGLRSYDPWGGNTPSGSLVSPLAYCGSLGHPTETDTGLIYMRARYYDPLMGRFISEDPAGDGVNWYAYAGNNPVGMVDPDGRMSFFDVYQADLAAGGVMVAIGYYLVKRTEYATAGYIVGGGGVALGGVGAVIAIKMVQDKYGPIFKEIGDRILREISQGIYENMEGRAQQRAQALTQGVLDVIYGQQFILAGSMQEWGL